jgi:tetratricopeptide (TPR) repeat protein
MAPSLILMGVMTLLLGADVAEVSAPTPETAAPATTAAEKPDLGKALANTEPPPNDTDLNRLTVAALKQSKDGDFLTAAAWYQAIIRLYPQNAILYFNLGNCYQKLSKEYEEVTALARESYQKAVELRPDLWEASLNLAVMDQKEGRLADAEQTYSDLLKRYPKNNIIRLNLALCYLQTDRLQEALDILTPAAKDARAARLSAIILTRLGRYDDAQQAWLRSLQLDPKSALGGMAKNRMELLEKGEVDDLTEMSATLPFNSETGDNNDENR